MVDAIRLPVIAAAGSPTDAARPPPSSLARSAVQIGTAYLATPQATTCALHRAALREALDDATRLTNLFTGRPARGLVNRFMREHGPMNDATPASRSRRYATAPFARSIGKSADRPITLRL